MFDSIFNYIIVLIPVAIFVGRLLIGAINKAQATADPALEQLIHFEEEEEDEEEDVVAPLGGSGMPILKSSEKKKEEEDPEARVSFSREDIPQGRSQGRPPRAASRPSRAGQTLVPQEDLLSPLSARSVQAQVREPARSISETLSHLSPLKQAVIMAEILGPPKGLQDE
ncbi:MAG: hypothetical protein FWH12_07450 [Treponema sp.]|nr:hypothetical protein [Treponema sp.]